MTNPVPMAEIWRGDFLESVHMGHAVICDASGDIVQAWGDADKVILPRSSSKMIQALPLIESGAAAAAGVTVEQLALACASHSSAAIHTDRVTAWLDVLGLAESDMRCGAHKPQDTESHHALIRADQAPCQIHNNCSGKHAGFLTLNQHIKGNADYVDPTHPVQTAVLEAFEELTNETSPGFGIDGCSAPNHASTLHGFARAMAFFAAASDGGATVRECAAATLVQAMTTYPELVAGEGRACTELMRAMNGRVAVKTGAEAVYIAIIPELKLGVALKIVDGTTRAAECAIAAILVKLGVLAPKNPATLKRMNAAIVNCNGITTGYIRPAKALL